ncbi:MAG: ABC transporter ATP-binding protein [Firmicutes bacterium]|nr:ABC transporter ATP-binding protein [Bacillota bacterium]
MSSDAVLQIDNLRVSYRQGRAYHPALEGISLDLRAGEAAALIGESGGGKTTLAHAIVGCLPADARVEGSIRLEGRELGRPDDPGEREYRGKKIGMVFQQPESYLNPLRPVAKQVMEAPVYHRRWTRAEAPDRARELLETVGLPQIEQRMWDYPFQFSGGMNQRVAWAAALACRPSLLVLDEATSFLDPEARREIGQRVDYLKKEWRMGVLIISHDLTGVADLADRVLVMRKGNIIEAGPTDRVLRSPREEYTREMVEAALEEGSLRL